jgi:hypothetical protein
MVRTVIVAVKGGDVHHCQRASCVNVLAEGAPVANDTRDSLTVLKTESEFFEKGGYLPTARAEWLPQVMFQDSKVLRCNQCQDMKPSCDTNSEVPGHQCCGRILRRPFRPSEGVLGSYSASWARKLGTSLPVLPNGPEVRFWE